MMKPPIEILRSLACVLDIQQKDRTVSIVPSFTGHEPQPPKGIHEPIKKLSISCVSEYSSVAVTSHSSTWHLLHQYFSPKPCIQFSWHCYILMAIPSKLLDMPLEPLTAIEIFVGIKISFVFATLGSYIVQSPKLMSTGKYWLSTGRSASASATYPTRGDLFTLQLRGHTEWLSAQFHMLHGGHPRPLRRSS